MDTHMTTNRKAVLITGVAGLLGSRLADYITKHHPEYIVVGVDDLSGGFLDNVNTRVAFYRMDCGSAELKNVFQRYNVEYVYHFACYAAEGLSPFIRKFNYTNNLVATANIVNLCIQYNVKRLVFTSSMAVYGAGTPPFSETDVYGPIDPYGVAKMAAEMDIKIAGEQHGLDWCIIRPHNVYGVKQNIYDAYRNVLGIWMFYSLNDKPITVYGDGKQTRAFSFIDDSLVPLWRASHDENVSKQIINLGGIYETSIGEAAQMLSTVTGNTNIIHLPARHEVKHAFPTYQKSIDLLGFEHKTSLHDGLQLMWSWAQTQPRRQRFVWSEYEVDIGLYPFWKQENLLK